MQVIGGVLHQLLQNVEEKLEVVLIVCDVFAKVAVEFSLRRHLLCAKKNGLNQPISPPTTYSETYLMKDVNMTRMPMFTSSSLT